ncbi:MAG: response regulator [Candidatus Brocadiales bacterium]|nr:response regulator [Candidatus Brocadiales bacterium]
MNKILVVDDERKICELIKRLLETRGLYVNTSNSGEDALEKTKNEHYDVILLDIRMPGINGIEVLENIKEISPETMVIIHTGCSDIDFAIDAIRLNVSDYILKPVKLDELHFRILHCIEKSELQRKIKIYEKILPVCCVCKKIRDDTNKEHGTGKWMTMETYISEKANIDVSHGYCPECLKTI